MSLQTLIDISQHQAFFRVMSHLIIGLDEFAACNEFAMANFEEYSRWRSATSAQQTLLQTGVFIDHLSTALTNLPSLETIEIRDFNSPTRYRDAVGNRCPEWRSYGSSLYTWRDRHPGLSLLDSHEHRGSRQTHDFVGQVFKAVLAAIGRSSPKLVSLEFILRNDDYALVDDAFAISPALRPGLTQTLHGLTKLHLYLRTQKLRLPQNLRPKSGLFDSTTTYLRSFLALTTNITWLRLNFDPVNSPDSDNSRFLAWLGLRPGYRPSPTEMGWNEMNPAPIALPLRRLDLGNISLSTDVLHEIVTKFPNLESLCLRVACIILRDEQPSAPSLLDENGVDENGDCIWAKFIRGLSASAPNLKQISLSRLEQAYRGMVDPIVFDDPECPSIHSVANIDHSELEALANMTWTIHRFFWSTKRRHKIFARGSNRDMDEDETRRY